MPSSKYTPQQRKEAEKEVSGDRKVFATGRVTHNGRAYYQEYIEGLDDRSADRLISLGYAVEGKEAQKAAAVAKTSEKEGQKAIPAQPGGASNPRDPIRIPRRGEPRSSPRRRRMHRRGRSDLLPPPGLTITEESDALRNDR
jgi:hypothetical protein